MAWLSGWEPGQRFRLEIDNTLIDGELTNFPVMVKLSDASGIGDVDLSAVFDELEDESLKIAVTTSDEVTECKVEIEYWDDASETAILHVKVPTVASGTDTVLYLYYDSSHADNTTNVGDTGDAAAESVWDSDFKAVLHMAQDPSGGANCILDSTSNDNDGTPGGTMLTEDLVDSVGGRKGLDFDGSNDNINIGSDVSLDDIAPLFAEFVFNADTYGENNFGRLFAKNEGGTNEGLECYLAGASEYLSFLVRTNSVDGRWNTPDASIALSTDYYYGVFFDRTPAPTSHVDAVLYLNGAKPAVGETGAPTGSYASDASRDLIIGSRLGADRSFNGVISEVRFSEVERGDAWAKATYHTLFDTLITFEEDVGELSIDSITADSEITAAAITLLRELSIDSITADSEIIAAAVNLSGSSLAAIAMHHYTKNIGT